MLTVSLLYPMLTVSLLCVLPADIAVATSEASGQTLQAIQQLINQIGTFIDQDGKETTGQKEKEAWGSLEPKLWDTIGTLKENQGPNFEQAVEDELWDREGTAKSKQEMKSWDYEEKQKNIQRTNMWTNEGMLEENVSPKQWVKSKQLENNQWEKNKNLEYNELSKQWENTKKLEENGILKGWNNLEEFEENKLSKQWNKSENLERNQWGKSEDLDEIPLPEQGNKSDNKLPKHWDKSEKLNGNQMPKLWDTPKRLGVNHVPKQWNEIEALEDKPVSKLWNKNRNLKDYLVPNHWKEEKTSKNNQILKMQQKKILMREIQNGRLPHLMNHRLVDPKKIQELWGKRRWDNVEGLKIPQIESKDDTKMIEIEKMLSILCQKQKLLWIGCNKKDSKALDMGRVPEDKKDQYRKIPGIQQLGMEDEYPVSQEKELWNNQKNAASNLDLKALLADNWDSTIQNMERPYDNKQNIKIWGTREALNDSQDQVWPPQEIQRKISRQNTEINKENSHSNIRDKGRLTLQGKDGKMENNQRETKMWIKEKNLVHRHHENRILKPWVTVDAQFKGAKIGNGNWLTQNSDSTGETESYKDQTLAGTQDQTLAGTQDKLQREILALPSNVRNKSSKNNSIWKVSKDTNDESSNDEDTNDESTNDESTKSPQGRTVFNGFVKTPDGGQTGEIYFNGIFNSDRQQQQQQKEDEFKEVSEDRLDGTNEASNGITNEAHSPNGPATLNVPGVSGPSPSPGVSGPSVEAKNNELLSSREDLHSRKYSPENSISMKDIPEYDISTNYDQNQNMPKNTAASRTVFSGKMNLETKTSVKNNQENPTSDKNDSENLTSLKMPSEHSSYGQNTPRDSALMENILENKNFGKNTLESKNSLKNNSRNTTSLNKEIVDNKEGTEDGSNVGGHTWSEDETRLDTDSNLNSLLLSGIPISKAQHKRRIQDKPIGDGPFLVVVMGLTGMCILAVLGVGYCLHRPSRLARLPAPGSADISPTFHSAKLTFSAAETSPDSDNAVDKADNNIKNNNNRFTGSRAKIYERPTHFKTNPNMRVGRMESLITLTDDEEEGDLIYECPGLAPTGEMVVTNPFFLSGEIGHITDNNLPCPINSSGNIRHGNIIKGIN